MNAALILTIFRLVPTREVQMKASKSHIPTNLLAEGFEVIKQRNSEIYE
jgi:hypothetical protein